MFSVIKVNIISNKNIVSNKSCFFVKQYGLMQQNTRNLYSTK